MSKIIMKSFYFKYLQGAFQILLKGYINDYLRARFQNVIPME